MGIVVTKHIDSITVDLGGVSSDRKKARIKLDSIRSITESTDDITIEMIFTNGEIQGFPYTIVDSVDGNTDITTQDKLYNAMELVLFTI